jgi:glycosidase
VAEKVNIVFWKQFRTWVKEENPDAYITGEIWWDDWQKNKMFNASPWLQGDSFDGVMNYRFAQAVKSFVVDINDQISPEAFSDSIKAIAADYPKENIFVLQNLMDSHDVDRISSQIVNPDRWFDHNADPGQNKSYLVRKPNNEEMLKQKLIVAIQMTMPGAPMIYYGDEAGMWGGDDPDCRKPMVWPGMKYETEVSDPLGRKREPDKVVFDTKLFNWYKEIISIRKANNVLSEGNLEFIYADNTNKVLGYKRTLNNQTIFIILNNSSKDNIVTIKLDYGQDKSVSLKNLINGEKIIMGDNNLKVLLKPYEMKILSKKL